MAVGGYVMNYKSANTRRARNAGLTALGFMVVAIAWSIVGIYGFIPAPFVGIVTYINDLKGNNDPSKFDPAFTTLGGGLFLLLMCLVHAL